MNLYSPTILGPGLLIKEKPTDPKHAVRVQDVKEYATMQVVEFTDALNLEIPRRGQHNIVQVYDENSQMVTPNLIAQNPDKNVIEIQFLDEQTGYVLIFTVGGL